MLKSLLGTVALTVACSAFAGSVPDSVVVRYEIVFGGLTIGEASDRISFTADGYSIHSKARAKGIAKFLGIDDIESRSEGRLDDSGRLRMRVFHYMAGDRQRRATIAADGSSIELGENGNYTVLPFLYDLVDDPLTVLYMHYAAGRFMPLESLLVTDGRKASHYYVTQTTQPEELVTDAGSFSAVRQTRDAVLPSKQRAVWYAKELGYLPVKFIVSANFADLVFTLTSHEVVSAP